MWLPKPLYDLVPYLYVLAGLTGVGGAGVIARRVWGSTITFVFGLAVMAIGVAIWMKRRSARLDKAGREIRQLDLFDRSRAPP